MPDRIELTDSLDIALPDGSVLRLRAGSYGKGVTMSFKGPARGAPGRAKAGSHGVRGRPARHSTLELRAMLAQDAGEGKLKEGRHYIDWLERQEPKSRRATLQQTVYRELRAVGGARARAGTAKRRGGRKAQAASGVRGRKPHPGTEQLRDRLVKDKEGGAVREAAYYVRWLVEKANMGIKQARPIVYRELRTVR